jgi:hypothetical protein
LGSNDGLEWSRFRLNQRRDPPSFQVWFDVNHQGLPTPKLDRAVTELKNMRDLLFLIPAWLLSFSAFAQENPAVWAQLKTITGQHYQFSVPEIFLQLPTPSGKNPEQFFAASGVGLPITFNQGPVIVTIFLVRERCSSLEDCKHECLEGYRLTSDRVFSAGWHDRQEKLLLSGGEEASMLHTRFYRPSKGLHQSRFDLVVYSDKAKAGYLYTLSVQHADSSYKVETDLSIPSYAKSLFSRFQLR